MLLLAMLAVCRITAAGEPVRLDFDTIRVQLKTAHPDEEAYIHYVVALTDQDRLSRRLLNSAFDWARRKPVRLKKFQYFKQALITLAARTGITLPPRTPDLTPEVTGKVVMRIVLVDVPCAGAKVTLEGTKRAVVTDEKGQFTFKDVPFGTHTIAAQKTVALLALKGTAEVILPTDPPSTETAFVKITVK
jgi:hypothetical protein